LGHSTNALNKSGTLSTFIPSIETLPFTADIETVAVLKKLANAHQALAELKGVVASIAYQTQARQRKLLPQR
jgi:hypothetical protein